MKDHEDPDAQQERSFETGKDESWFANIKRTYDEMLQESLETIRNMRNENLVGMRESRTLFNKIITDAQQHDNTRQTIANQALQNAVETANMVGKQAVRHGDLSIDRQWNVDEQGHTVADILQSNTFKDAIAEAVAVAAQSVAAAMATQSKS